MDLSSIIIIVILLIDLFYARGYSIDWDKHEYGDRIEYTLYLDKFKGTFSIDEETIKKDKHDCEIEYRASTMEPNIKRKVIFKYIKKLK